MHDMRAGCENGSFDLDTYSCFTHQASEPHCMYDCGQERQSQSSLPFISIATSMSDSTSVARLDESASSAASGTSCKQTSMIGQTRE